MQWISVDDRLPKIEEEVIAFGGSNTHLFVCNAKIPKNYKKYTCKDGKPIWFRSNEGYGFCVSFDVKYWIPFPELPNA